jgi:hypothetical protein
MASRKRRVHEEDLPAVIEEELANDSDSDAGCVLELSSSDDNNSDSSELSDSGPGVQGFSKKD